jgi:hypothetical protein
MMNRDRRDDDARNDEKGGESPTTKYLELFWLQHVHHGETWSINNYFPHTFLSIRLRPNLRHILPFLIVVDSHKHISPILVVWETAPPMIETSATSPAFSPTSSSHFPSSANGGLGSCILTPPSEYFKYPILWMIVERTRNSAMIFAVDEGLKELSFMWIKSADRD